MHPVIPGVPVWDYPHVPGYDLNNEDAPSWPVVDLREALTKRWSTDAHATAYTTPGDPFVPRLRKASLAALIEHGSEPHCAVVFVDVDNSNHMSWAELADHKPKACLSLQKRMVNRLKTIAPSGAYIYTTRAGARLVWILDTPIPASLYKSWARPFLESLAIDIEGVDMCSEQWTRCFRLPYVCRDGVDTEPVVHFPTDPRPLPVGGLSALLEEIPATPLPPESYDLPSGEINPRDVPTALWSKIDIRSKAGRVITRLLAGSAIAEPGERNTTVFGIVASIASQLPDPHGTDPTILYRMVYQSALATLDPADMFLFWGMCERTAGKERASRAATEALELEETPEPEPQAPPRANTPGSEPLIWACGTGYFVRDRASGAIFGPFSATGLPAAVRDCQPEASVRTGTGGLLGAPELLFRYGTTASDLVYQMALDRDRYDTRTNSLVLRAAIPQPVTPERSSMVEEWLLMLGGSDPEALLDWLATVRRLSSPTSALYLQDDHDGGAGKGMLAAALGAIWGGTPVAFRDAIGQFNAGLVRQPIVHLDESWGNWRGTARVSSMFRTLVAESAHRIEQKYAPVSTLMGCPRVIIAANNADALDFSGSHTRADIQAITGRILHVSVSKHARVYLDDIGGRQATESGGWVTDRDGGPGRIARHIAWLEATRAVDHGKRYLVQGKATAYHQRMAISTGITTPVLMAVANAWGRSAQKGMGVSLDEGGEIVWVNSTHLQTHWERFVGASSDKVPSIPTITKTLASLSPDSNPLRKQTRYQAKNARHWGVPVELVIQVAKEQGMPVLSALYSAIAKNGGQPLREGGEVYTLPEQQRG